MPAGAAPDRVELTKPHYGPGVTHSSDGFLRLGTYRSIWAAPEVEISPALHYTIAEQLVELSPTDAARLGIEVRACEVVVSQNGTRLAGRAAIRTGVPRARRSWPTGSRQDSANALTEPMVEVTSRHDRRSPTPTTSSRGGSRSSSRW